MDFESRFRFETNLPPPRQIRTIKRRKSFSEKFFKKTGVQLKLAGKNTLKIRQKLAFRERIPASHAFNGTGNSCRSNPTTPQEISDVTSQNLTALSFPQLVITPASSVVINCEIKPDETPINATALSSVNAESEWASRPSLTDCEPIVLSSTADSYLPVSSNSSFITLQRRRDRSPVPLIKQSEDKFDTFKRSNFVLNYESEAPSFSTIKKNHINKSVANGSIQFNVSLADIGCSFDSPSYDTYPSLESNPRLSVTTPTVNSLKSFDSSKSPLAKSTPVSFGRDSNKLSVARTNFTCRVIPNNRTDSPANNRHRNSCSFGSAERGAIDKLNRHSICDIPIKDIPFPNDGISNISPIASTDRNSFQQELMSRCSQSVSSSQSKPILSICYADKPTVPVKPSQLKNQERSPQDSQLKLKREKEINNNSIFIVDNETLNTGNNLKNSSDAFFYRPDVPCKPDTPTCKPAIPACKPQIYAKPQIPTCKPQIPTGKPQIPTCKPQIPTCKSQIPACKSQIPACKSQIPACKSQIPACKSQIPCTHKLDIILTLTDTHTQADVPAIKAHTQADVPAIKAHTQAEVPAIKPKPILKHTLYAKKTLEPCSKIPLDNILKKQLDDTFNKEKFANLNKKDILSLSQSLKVRELVSTFNNVLKLPQTEYDKEMDNFQNNFTRKAANNDWNLCNSNGLPLPLGPLCGSIDFLRKRSLIEEKLPNMISLVANGSSSLRTQI